MVIFRGRVRSSFILATLVLVCLVSTAWAGEVTRFDFESGELEGWRVVEGAFADLVSDRAQSRNNPGTPYPKEGVFYLNTLELPGDGYNDGMTGIIESPAFVIEGDVLNLRVGGGAGPNVYVALCDETGEELLQARGSNAETMRAVAWDVSAYRGKTLFLSVVDNETGGWGHVTLDDVTIPGRIDEGATARLRENYGARQKARLEREAAHAAAMRLRDAERRKELMSEAYLFQPQQGRVYAGEHLEAISLPVGGIGSGCIQWNGAARPKVWQIFNNHTQAFVPHSFLAVRVTRGNETPVVRVLQTEAVGPFAPMASLTFKGEYPFGWYTFEDPELPVRVSLEVYNPLIPLETRDSAIPCAVSNVTVWNTSRDTAEEPITVEVVATQQNAVGYSGADEIQGRAHEAYGGNLNRVVSLPGGTMLHMTSNAPRESRGKGDMALMMLGEGVTGAATWDTLESLKAGFGENGSMETEPSPAGQTYDGALTTRFSLAPGAGRTTTVVLTWYFPNVDHGNDVWGGLGNQYNNWWENAAAVAMEVKQRLPELDAGTRRYHKAFYASNLPHWLLDRISSQVAILRTQTCFWQADGYFGGWEGCGSAGGCCQGNCSHVWHYAQAHARLFPEIGRLMREQEFAMQLEDGGIPHRQYPGVEPATDGHAGAILGVYREHLIGRDGTWLARLWPDVRQAMEFMITTWDSDEDGVFWGRQWNTLDDALGGSTTWMGSLYIAALRASAEMAVLQGEPDLAARYRRIADSGAKKQDQTLFDGEYYIQIPDPEPRRDYGPGCHIDQVLGQWWAMQLGLGEIYPRNHVRSAMGALIEHNFRASFHGIEQKPRKFVADDDAGMQMIQWPNNERPDPEHCIYYGDEVMTGFEYSAAAAMVQVGMLKEGFAVVRAIYDRYDGRLRTELTAADTASWGFSGNPFGDDECGKFYARAMSVWSLLLASQGFDYDGPAEHIGFAPVWQPEDHASFFTAAEGWGTFRQTREDGVQREELALAYGTLGLESMAYAVADGKQAKSVVVLVNGAEIPASFEQTDTRVLVDLGERATLSAEDHLEVRITL